LSLLQQQFNTCTLRGDVSSPSMHIHVCLQHTYNKAGDVVSPMILFLMSTKKSLLPGLLMCKEKIIHAVGYLLSPRTFTGDKYHTVYVFL